MKAPVKPEVMKPMKPAKKGGSLSLAMATKIRAKAMKMMKGSAAGAAY